MATPTSVSFHTLGCKLNFSETSTIRRQFESQGYVVRPFEHGADIAVINTCSVTDFADRKCRKSVRSALRKNPACKIIVVGCYAQLKPTEIAEIEGVDLVLGAGQKFEILDYLAHLENAPSKGMVLPTQIETLHNYRGAFSFGDRTRSFLKVQDGCNYKCSFCTIPQARGESRSGSISELVDQVHELARLGAKEVVLTGVNIGDFGLHNGVRKEHFLDLLKALDQIENIARFRISSIEPNLCSQEIIQVIAASRKIVPHLHMPLQSGNDKQLRQMRRRYRRENYQERVRQIKDLMPHACVGADVIVGFPGESDQDFQTTYDFIETLPVNYLHVFTYSERSDTDAVQLQGTVPMEVRRARNKRLRLLSERKKAQFLQQSLGQCREVLLENSSQPSMWTGFTDNYVKVMVPSSAGHKVNDLVKVKLLEVDPNGLVVSEIRSEIPV